ncbi:copper homeostasis protein CutC [Dyella nitratireducens]|uniref:PF03932 family protein CutC n=1 Tax=Dyella nitratireducens TaxID=1849580 RepID=A0ABQ1FLU8_9GAMM|nr:copper homeostasis protein CutC [Dyella nitratireducens]GGA18697.1 copper homeostasis protein CutC [Dyella nitratireducens]GLQ44619.1 copper homeostasis protein CutC [Dyella nitratireducens]
MSRQPLLEIAAGSLASALAAQEGGADRVELCSSLAEGGITPSYGMLAVVRERVRIPVYVLVRPRGGDFLYDDVDFDIMQRDIETCASLGFNGVVIGALNAEGYVDPRCRELMNAAGKLGVTFHRAIDASADLNRALDDIMGLGCERVLTSGGCANALAGAQVIAGLVRQAGERIKVMAGAGIRSGNLAEVVRLTGAHEFHGSARAVVKSSMRYLNLALKDLAPDIEQSSVEEVRAMKAQLAG